jgi:hypothetical protein
MTARRASCRCCGMPGDSARCGPCTAEHVRHAATVRAAILAAFGSQGLVRYETTLRAQRLSVKRTTTRRTP